MKKIVFVCLGNICRSPMAEFIMKDVVGETSIHIESRATSSWEMGHPIHAGTQRILTKYALPFDQKKGSQQISVTDLEQFDLVIGMDEQNVRDLQSLSQGRFDEKIHLFCPGGVPDPWYTGDFEETYTLVSQGCRDWFERVRDDRKD